MKWRSVGKKDKFLIIRKISPRDVMYSMVTIGNNTASCIL